MDPDISIIEAIILIAFGILNIILFFKIWQMTNNVKEIMTTLKSVQEKQSIKYSIGEHVFTPIRKGTLEIIEVLDNGSYRCKDVETDKNVGVYKEYELIKK